MPIERNVVRPSGAAEVTTAKYRELLKDSKGSL